MKILKNTIVFALVASVTISVILLSQKKDDEEAFNHHPHPFKRSESYGHELVG